MSDAATKVLREALDSLKPAGFARKGMLARKRVGDVSILVEAQRSQYGARYFLNLGFWFHALGDAPAKLPVHKCHYYGRTGHEINDALSFETSCDDDRELRIKRYFAETLVPMLTSIENAASLSDWIQEGRLTSPIVLPPAQRFFRLGPDSSAG